MCTCIQCQRTKTATLGIGWARIISGPIRGLPVVVTPKWRIS